MKNYIGTSVAANYFRGPESVGGKLYFEEQCMVFKSHAFNFQTGETKIDYSSIVQIEKCMTLFVPNGMIVVTNDGKRHRFVINNRSSVIEFLSSRL